MCHVLSGLILYVWIPPSLKEKNEEGGILEVIVNEKFSKLRRDMNPYFKHLSELETV